MSLADRATGPADTLAALGFAPGAGRGWSRGAVELWRDGPWWRLQTPLRRTAPQFSPRIGPWRAIGDRLACELPCRLGAACEADDAAAVARCLRWVLGWIDEDACPPWRPRGKRRLATPDPAGSSRRERIAAALGPDPTVQCGSSTRQTAVIDSRRTALGVQLARICDELPRGRRRWLDHVLADVHSLPMVRVEVERSGRIHLRADLTAAPEPELDPIARIAAAELRRAAAWSLETVLLLTDPCVPCRATEVLSAPQPQPEAR